MLLFKDNKDEIYIRYNNQLKVCSYGKNRCYSQKSKGEETQMPRIHDEYLDCVVYIYATEQEANEGSGSGASGFITSMEFDYESVDGRGQLYIVTNRHVILTLEQLEKEGAFHNSFYIRLNTSEGEVKTFPTRLTDWVYDKLGDDLAVCPMNFSDQNLHLKYKSIPTNQYITEELIEKHGIGIGDDVFLLGRFFGHSGIQNNTPVARFGNISMMPKEPVKTKMGGSQLSFLIELRTVSGFSGSLVFVHCMHNTYRPSEVGFGRVEKGFGFLLGVLWGHLEEWFEPNLQNKLITSSPTKKTLLATEVEENQKVWINTGMGMVVPAWRLLDLLNCQKLTELREEDMRKTYL